MLFPDEEGYNIRMASYRKWYANKKKTFSRDLKIYTIILRVIKEEWPMVDNDINKAIERLKLGIFDLFDSSCLRYTPGLNQDETKVTLFFFIHVICRPV